MCSIVGISGQNVTSKLETMLNVLAHRGPDGKGIYIDNKIIKDENISKYNLSESDFLLGHNLLSIIGHNELQPIQLNNLILISNAEIYNYKKLIEEFNLKFFSTRSDCEIIIQLVNHYYTDNLKEAVLKTLPLLDGDYAFCITDGKDFLVVRDEVGVKPVYYTDNPDFFAFASEQKALKKIGSKSIHDLKPTDAIYNNKIVKIRENKHRLTEYSDYDIAKDELKDAIKKSVIKRIDNLDNVALLFSAGVDSTLIAVLLKEYGIDTTLYTVGTENSQDLKFAKKTADDIELPLKIKIINEDDVKNSFLDTVNAIEDTNLMKIGVGMTVNLTSQLAHINGEKVILSGQGADELFCGYNRYKNKYQNPNDLKIELLNDLNNMYHVNLERDDKATMNNSIELRVPYLDKQVIRTSLQMPINYLLHSEEDNIRKHILRDVAYELGVPKQIAYRPKKAAQYGTGIDKILRKKVIKNEPYKSILENQ